MAWGEVPNVFKDFEGFITLGGYTQSYESPDLIREAQNAYAITEGEDIGIREYDAHVSVGSQNTVSVGGGVVTIGLPQPYIPPVVIGRDPIPGGGFVIRVVYPDGREAEYVEGSPYDPTIRTSAPPADDFPVDGSYGDVVIPPDLVAGPDPYEPEEEQTEVAIDWGDVLLGGLNTAIDLAQGQSPTGVPVSSFAPPAAISAPAVTGAEYTVNPATGAVTKKCKRRRRRRLLTESDFNDLMRISTLPNKENVRVALAKAVGRR